MTAGQQLVAGSIISMALVLGLIVLGEKRRAQEDPQTPCDCYRHLAACEAEVACLNDTSDAGTLCRDLDNPF